MIIFVNSENEIKDVNTTNDESLTALEINDEDNPFRDWSIAKICCYKVNVTDGVVTMMTPCVDSRLIEHLDRLGQEVPKRYSKRAYIGDTTARFAYSDGVVQASVINELGESVPCSVSLDNDIVVTFDELQSVATVTISIS